MGLSPGDLLLFLQSSGTNIYMYIYLNYYIGSEQRLHIYQVNIKVNQWNKHNMLWQFLTLLSSQETASWAEAGVQCRLLHASASLAMPKTAEANKFLAEVNTNLTEAGDAVHADMWVLSFACVFTRNYELWSLWKVDWGNHQTWRQQVVLGGWHSNRPEVSHKFDNIQFHINSCSSLQVLNWAPGQPDNVYGGMINFCEWL